MARRSPAFRRILTPFFALSLVLSMPLAGCGGSDGKAVPLAETPADPFFGAQFPDPQGQQDAALAMIDVADAMAEMAAGRSTGADTALSADKLFDEYSSTLYSIGELFFDGTQSEIIESFLYYFGPVDPFLNKPFANAADLKPGDILVSTTDARMSQMIRVFGWGHYSHAFVYAGDGMITEAVGNGVQKVPLATALKGAIRAGVMRDPTLTTEMAQAIVASANAKIGSDYNWKGLAAMAYQKNVNLAAASTSGFSAMVAALTTVDEIPGELGANGKYFCSQLVTASYKGGGNPLFTKSGASPNDIVRLAESGRLQFVGRLAVPEVKAVARLSEPMLPQVGLAFLH